VARALDDAEERPAQTAGSFFIPPAEPRSSLTVGENVKLIFRLERDDGEVSVERMWVDVVETCPYVGNLLNTRGELGEPSNALAWDLGYLTDRFPQTVEAVREGSQRLHCHEVGWSIRLLRPPSPEAGCPQRLRARIVTSSSHALCRLERQAITSARES
jgi:hypothetical protein